MAQRLEALAAQQPGYLGVEAARDGLGITVSYWLDEGAAAAWKQVAEHLVAQERGRKAWYVDYQYASRQWPVRTAMTALADGRPRILL